MSLFPFPFKRKPYDGIDNPRFVDDIVAANEAVLDGLKAITGLNDNGFAIISGFFFDPGVFGNYTPGIFFLKGVFYYMPTGFDQGFYLSPVLTDTMPQPFGDLIVRNIYTLQQAQTSAAPVDGCPIFNGNMNQYRLSLTYLNESLLVLQALYGNLKSAAFRDVGTTAGTVAAGDDPRFGYTKAQIDTLFALKSQVLLFGNTTPFTPILDYEPATKKYVDTATGMKLRWVGSVDSSGAIVNKFAGDLTVTVVHVGTGLYTINHGLGSVGYFVCATGWGTGFNLASVRSVINQAANSFQVCVSDDASANDAPFTLQIIQFNF